MARFGQIPRMRLLLLVVSAVAVNGWAQSQPATPKGGDTSKRAAAAKAGPAVNPKKAQAKAFFAGAFELYRSGEFEAAKLQLNKGLELDPDDYRAHFLLAQTLEALKDGAGATKAYKRVVELATPSSNESARSQIRLGEIEKEEAATRQQAALAREEEERNAAPKWRVGQWWKYRFTYYIGGVARAGPGHVETVKAVDGSGYTTETIHDSGQRDTRRYDLALNVKQVTDARGTVPVRTTPRFEFPLTPGKSWSGSSTSVAHQQTGTEKTNAVVGNVEQINTALGSFSAITIQYDQVLTNSAAGPEPMNFTNKCWFVKEMGQCVKLSVDTGKSQSVTEIIAWGP